ncbi:MAG: hypothetical protein DI564_11995 [Rhodanobacter denitrificans]|uniref:Uncharacterized protein n=1 Tax=Rhodanobacter denitrificans TaxID=666685 RepID=A0A2W5K7T6_9GAMM|nr:MAG: hypothetical protein DI564_11995 [Rhodanobacter denitrificans]
MSAPAKTTMPPQTPAATRRHRFFAAIALLMLAAVVAGFWGTLFRPAEPLRPYLLVHGAIVAAWFGLFAMQTLLVAAGHTRLHRRLGVIGVCLAVAVVASSLYTMANLPANWRQQGIDLDAQRGLIGLILWGDFGALVAFGTLLICAVVERRRPDAHKRLMLLAMCSIMSPALIRLAALPPFAGFDGVLLTMLGLLALGLSLIAYDLVTLRRVHRATAWGVPFFLVVHLAPAFAVPGTALDRWVMALIV